jgi:hypothetical protein
MNWIYLPTGFSCRTRKEMKDYLGKVSFFRAALKRNEIIFITDSNCIAYDELQETEQQNCRGIITF